MYKCDLLEGGDLKYEHLFYMLNGDTVQHRGHAQSSFLVAQF